MMPPCCVVPYRLPALSKTIVPQKCAPWFGLGRYKIFVLPPPQAGITRKRATHTTAQTRANEVENRRGIARRTDMGVLLSAGGKLDGKPATAKPAAQMLDLSWGLCKGNRCRVVAQFDDAPSKPEPRRTQSATKLFVLRLSFVDLRALCGKCFGKMSHYPLPSTLQVAPPARRLSGGHPFGKLRAGSRPPHRGRPAVETAGKKFSHYHERSLVAHMLLGALFLFPSPGEHEK